MPFHPLIIPFESKKVKVPRGNQINQTACAMFAKVKSLVFIDMLQLQLSGPKGNFLRGILKDEKGSVCCTLEKDIAQEHEELTWTGLNDLPYGRYTLELSQGEDEMKMNLVKRI